jgi:enoyl-CoA hydratase/carnithine racemase
MSYHIITNGGMIRPSDTRVTVMTIKSRINALLGAIAFSATLATGAVAADAPYFDDYKSLKIERSDSGVLVATMHTDGGPINFTAKDHTEFVEAFYRIGHDRDNKVVILTGQGDWMAQIDFSTFGNVGDAETWSPVHDEGVQILENLMNIRVPVIAAIEGKAHIHSEYALTANVVVAGKSASFSDLPHFAGGIVPGDGIFTTWSYRAGPGRAEGWLLNPQPISADTAYNWGVVSEVVEDGKTVARAQELAALYLKQPELTRRNTRIHFAQPLKERIVKEVGYGLALEGASANALVKKLSQ